MNTPFKFEGTTMGDTSAPVTQSNKLHMNKLSILCLASENKASLISECSLVERVHHVRTVAAAHKALEKDGTAYHVLIAALGTTPESRVIERDAPTGMLTSPLFLFAMRRCPLMYRIVFSHTACQSRDSFRLCIATGADAVVCKKEELELSIRRLLNIDSVASPSSIQGSSHTVNEAAVSKEIVVDRRERENQLINVALGWKTHRFRQSHNWTEALQQQIERLVVTPKLTHLVHENTDNESIRVIHVSDTHNMHRLLKIPPGDLFLHSGDICNNKNPQTDLVGHFADFLHWLHSDICPQFAKVVFIAGNHDVYLDPCQRNRNPEAYQKAQHILHSFLLQHPNVSYLQDSATTYRGLTIYGTPTCICRVECMGKRYLSNGFERNAKDRERLFSQIPRNVDVLLTHVPPLGFGSDNEAKACKLLTQRVHQHAVATEQAAKETPLRHPLLHVFGHEHAQYGVAQVVRKDQQRSSTVLLNGCQENLLLVDPGGGGSPLVVDLPLMVGARS